MVFVAADVLLDAADPLMDPRLTGPERPASRIRSSEHTTAFFISRELQFHLKPGFQARLVQPGFVRPGRLKNRHASQFPWLPVANHILC